MARHGSGCGAPGGAAARRRACAAAGQPSA
jgi:hypothetical protein